MLIKWEQPLLPWKHTMFESPFKIQSQAVDISEKTSLLLPIKMLKNDVSILFFQIKPRTQSTWVSPRPNLCLCNPTSTLPEAISLTQCPVWCPLTWGSIILPRLEGSTGPWQPPWWLRGPVSQCGWHGNEDRRGRVHWRWASGHRGKGSSKGETLTGENTESF